jgi:hypothetical protein
MYKPQYPGLYYFDNFTFTTLGTSGARGPDASKTYANAPWRDGDFYIKDGQQYWTVPANGTYQIEAAGAYGAAPGRVVTGQVKLNEGQTLKMLVGQCPNPLVSNVRDNVTVGGGGGTFVVSGDTPLIVASGGDGGQFANTYNLFQSFPGPIICSALSGDGNTLFTVVDAGEANDPRGIAYFYTREVNSWVQQNYQVPWPDDPFGIESASFNFDGTVLLIGMAVNDYAGVSKLTTNGIWSPFTQLSAGAASGQRFGSSVALSSDGTVAIVSASYIYYVSCFRFNGSMWSSPTVITTLYGPAIDINSDGTVVIAGKNLGGVAVFRYSGGLWDSGTVITHTSVPFTYFGASVSISNDGNTILVGAPVGSLLITGEYAALYTYNGSTWINSANLYPPIPYSGFGSPVRLSGDGTTAFVSALAGLNGGYVVGFRNGIGSMFQVSQAVNFGRQLCTMYTGNEAFAAGDFYSDFNGIFTYTVSQHASFTPSGNGSGKQGAGLLTDGYSTDPYFKFLKPKAYVNGGFGNAYQYGSIPEQGGFGGGQSPIFLQNQISLISGNAFVRPVLTASTAYLSSVKLSYDGNVCMTYESTRVVKIFRFAGGVWSSPTTISSSRTTPYISLSWDGNVALFGGGAYVGVRIYSNGSWGTVTQLTNSSSSVALSGDGQTALIGSLTVTSVFKYLNGSWGTATVIQSPASKVALNFNGTKAVLNANVYQFSGSVWSKQKQLTDSITNFASCSISGDGTQVLISETRGRTFLFNLTTGTSSQLVNNYNGSSLSSDGSFITINEKYNVYGNTYTLSPVPVSIAQQNGLRSDIGGSNVFCIWAIGSSNIWFGSVTQPYTTINVTTTNNHGFPYEYIVQIQGTQGYDGTWPITVTSENTFTFEGFGGIYGTPETAGYISGPVTGISGGGGYTGSPGDGVSGATCYADESVENFTDLGSKSNTAGYVTVSLIDPKPIVLDVITREPRITKYYSGRSLTSILWCPDFNKFFAVSDLRTVIYSSDLQIWKGTDSPFSRAVTWSPKLKLFTSGTATSTDGINWTQHDSDNIFVFITWCDFMNCFIGWNKTENYFWTPSYLWKSYDGIVWIEMTDGPLLYNQSENKLSIAFNSNSLVTINTSIYGYVPTNIYSYNGSTWTTTPYGGGYWDRPKQIIYYNDQYVLFDYWGRCLTSSNGIIWTYRSSIPETIDYSASCIEFNKRLYICLGLDYSFSMYSSNDLLEWTRVNPIGDVLDYMYFFDITLANDVVFGNTHHYGKMLVSLNCSVWCQMNTNQWPGSGMLWSDATYSPETGYIVAVGNTDPTNHTTIFYSKDGIAWEPVVIDDTPRSIYGVTWIREIGKFLLNQYNTVYLTDPLDNWNSEISPKTQFMGGYWCPINNTLFSMNGDQTNDGYNWRNNPSATYTTNFGWVYPNTIIIDTKASNDGGSTWQYVLPDDRMYRFGSSGKTCMTIGIGHPAYPTDRSVLISNDGFNWTQGTLPAAYFVECKIFWMDSIQSFVVLFINFMPGETTVYTTKDGKSWTFICQNDENIRAATIFKNTLFMIFYSGNYTMHVTF